MALTDRAILKERQAGQAQGYGLAAHPNEAVAAVHSRSRDFLKTGTENAETNVAESPMFTVNRKSRLSSIKLLTGTNVAASDSDHVKIYVYKRTSAGASQTLVASWNTVASAQGAITLNVPASLSVVTSSDRDIDAGSILTYHIGKFGNGQAVAAPSTFTVDLEEI